MPPATALSQLTALPIGDRLGRPTPDLDPAIWTPIEFDLRGSTCDKQRTLDERFAALQPREGKMIGLVGPIALLLSAPKQFHPTAQATRGVSNNGSHPPRAST